MFNHTQEGSALKTTHAVIWHDPNYYYGWPANHGAWQWGDIFLFGAMRGPYQTERGMHNIGLPFEKVLLRSLNGGDNWVAYANNNIPDFNADPRMFSPTPSFNLHDPDTIIRVCGVYDHGGEDCAVRGGFYLSHDRGLNWTGPHHFDGLEECFPDGIINTSRTCVLKDNAFPLIFLSRGNDLIWGQDETFCVTHTNGGGFKFRGMVCNDNARAVMPAVARVRDTIVVVLRRRQSGKRKGWIEAFSSIDLGKTWDTLSHVDDTGSHNGNPPALVALPDGRLVCAYGNRDYGEMRVAISENAGLTWDTHLLRASECERVDIGYPRLFVRNDGKIVCVYYWTSDERPQQHIASTTFEI